MNEAIIELAATLGIAVNEIIGHYVVWHIASAITWILLAFLTSWFLLSKRYSAFCESLEYGKNILIWTKAIGLIWAMFIIGSNLPDLFSPTAISIHQLIIDLTP